LHFNKDGGIIDCVVKTQRRATTWKKIKMKYRKLLNRKICQSQFWSTVPGTIEGENAQSVAKDATGIVKADVSCMIWETSDLADRMISRLFIPNIAARQIRYILTLT